MHGDHPTGLLHRLVHDSHVHRRERPENDHLKIMTLISGGNGSVQAGLDHRPVREKRDIAAGS